MDLRLALVDAAAAAAALPVASAAASARAADPADRVGTVPRPTRQAVAPVTLALVVPVGRAMRLSRPRGSRLSVAAGRVWVTQSGRAEDCFLGAGDGLDVLEAGVLVLESDGSAPALVHLGHAAAASRAPRAGALRRWLEGARAALREGRRRRAVAALDDRMLRDIGVPAALRRAIAAERCREAAAYDLLWRSRASW
jgi:hypothetical protein